MVYVVKDAADFKSRLETDKLVLVDFFATWCGPCKVIAPRLDELQKIYSENIVVLKVDVDECEDLAAEYNISSMPTFVYIKNKEVVYTFTGANTEKLEFYIQQYIK